MRAKNQMKMAAQAAAEEMAAPLEDFITTDESLESVEVEETPVEDVVAARVEESAATPTKNPPDEADEPSSHTEAAVEQSDTAIENQVAIDQAPAEAEVTMPVRKRSKAKQKKYDRRVQMMAEAKTNRDEDEGTAQGNTFIHYEAGQLRNLESDTNVTTLEEAEIGAEARVDLRYDVSQLANGSDAEGPHKPGPLTDESLPVYDEPTHAVSMPEPECPNLTVKPKLNEKLHIGLEHEERKVNEEALLAALSPYAEVSCASQVWDEGQLMPCASVLLKYYSGKLNGLRWDAVVMSEELKARNSDLEDQMTNLYLEIDKKTAEHAVEVTRLRNQLEMLNQRDYELFQRLRADIKQWEQYREDAQKTAEKHDSSLDEAKRQVARLSTDLRASEDDTRDEVYNMEREVEVLTAQNADDDEEIKGLKVQIEELERKTHREKKFEQEEKRLLGLIHARSTENKALHGDVSVLAKREHQQGFKIKELETLKKKQDGAIARLKRELAAAQKVPKQKPVQDMAKPEQDLKALRSHISALQKRENEMKTQLAQHEGSIQDIRHHIEVAKKETDTQKQALQAQIDRLRSNTTAELKDLREEAQRQREENSEYALAAVVKDEVIADLYAANGRAETKIVEDDQRIKGLKLEIAALNLMVDERNRTGERGDNSALASCDDYEIV